MNYERKLVIRLFSALIAILFYNFIFYETVKPLTIFGSYFFLSLFDTGISLTKNAIISGTHTFEFIHACIASSAYFLLFILIIATKDIRFVKSIKMMLVGTLLILLMNIFRIDLLILASLKFGKEWFDAIHLVFWKLLSTIYVAGIWIFLILKFKVRTIPLYSDIKELIKHLKQSKPRRH